MKNARFALPLLLAAAAFSLPAHATCTFPALCPVTDIQVSFFDDDPDNIDEVPRREYAVVTEDLASALGIDGAIDEGDPDGPNPQIRVRISESPDSDIDTNNAVFTVVGTSIETGNRIWVYRRQDASDTEAGEFKLFGFPDDDEEEVYAAVDEDPEDGILDGIELEAYSIPVSKSSYTTTGIYFPSTFYSEPSNSKSYTEKAFRKPGDDRVAALAPHGGNIETDTSSQVNRFASSLETLNGTEVSTWVLEGKWGNGQTDDRWHITATSIDIGSYPALGAMLPGDDTFDRAVSFHGFSVDNQLACEGNPPPPPTTFYQIILGGSADRNLKCAIAQSIRSITDNEVAINIRDDFDPDISLTDDCGRNVTATGREGTHQDNIVNRITSFGGIQVEQSKTIRDSATLRDEVADAVAYGFAIYALASAVDYCEF